jgi:hypothetical protein
MQVPIFLTLDFGDLRTCMSRFSGLFVPKYINSTSGTFMSHFYFDFQTLLG